jgi:DNA methyltransferase 1-associated protein 1
MSDVHDMLGIGAPRARPVTAAEEASRMLSDKPKVRVENRAKKPKGMKREVFDLVGKDSLVPSVQSNSLVGGAGFKSKRVVSAKGKWLYSPIENSARKDHNATFFHWIRADKHYKDYPYAQFNVKLDKLAFTEEEYRELLLDDEWSISDTHILLDTCWEYDLRWPVIRDRIVLSRPKSLEQMEARYYNIRDTMKSRSASHYTKANYDADKETIRRKKQDNIFFRTKEDELEEIKLREDLKAVEALLKKTKKPVC